MTQMMKTYGVIPCGLRWARRMTKLLVSHGLVIPGLLAMSSCSSSMARLEGLMDGGNQGAAAVGPVAGSREMASTLGRAYVVSAVREPLNYLATGMAMAVRRPTELLKGNLPSGVLLGDTPPSQPGTLEFERWLTDRGIPEPVDGSMQVLVDGTEFFNAMRKETEGARKSIDIQTFIFDNDDFAVAFAESLKRRSGQVPVRVMYDDLGTALSSMSAPETAAPEGFVSPSSISRVLKGSGIKARRTLNPWLTADHSKMFLFDGKRAYVGGMNIGREYRSEWHDLMVRLEGPVVGVLAEDYEQTWKSCRFPGSIPGVRPPSMSVQVAEDPRRGIRVLRTDVVKGRFEILTASIAAIRAAEDRVWLQTPYFSSDTIERELLNALERGVDVRLVIPSKVDSDLMELANGETARDLVQAGGKVFVYPGMTHLKALVCDDWAMVGSANFDTLSMSINRELNVSSADRVFVRSMVRRVFEKDFRKSVRFRSLEPAGVAEVLAEAVADQL